MKFDLSTYISPLTWHYGSPKMRRIFSEENKYHLWRKVWVALARAQKKVGLVSERELNDLVKHQKNIDIPRILEIEEETKHDIVAAIREFAEKAHIGGGKIHLGATSMDIVDNAEVLRLKEAFEITHDRLQKLLLVFAQQIERYAHTVCMGYTHLQPAEPTTIGYRLASYAQDLLTDASLLHTTQSQLKGKGFKGAVGTSASYKDLLGKKLSVSEFEKLTLEHLGISAFEVSGQAYPRKLDYLVLVVLSSIAQSIAKFATDLRLLQSASFGEWSEPFDKKQVGSSAMPFKKNPVTSERICSLARFVAHLPDIAWENATLSHLERTHDDLANRRLAMAHGFILIDEILIQAEKIVANLVVNQKRIAYNVHQYGPFAATERLIIEAVKNGANRQEMHELLRQISLEAWTAVQNGKPNPMQRLVSSNKTLQMYLKKERVVKLLDISSYIGDAPERALKLVKQIKKL